MPISSDVQSSSPGNLVTLYELDATMIGGSSYAFTSTTIQGASVIFGGVVYNPLPVVAQGFETSGQGAFPTPTLQMSAIVLDIVALLIQVDDLIGAKFTRRRTFRRYLDDQPLASTNQQFIPNIFYVARKSKEVPGRDLEFELKSIVDQQGAQLPARLITKTTCPWAYRVWDSARNQFINTPLIEGGCPYVGNVYFDINGNIQSSPSQDVCGKRISDCKKRFGTATLPYGAFPGVTRI